MYKITLYDANCCPICDGVTTFFVDKLEDFEEHWLKQDRVDEDQKGRYFCSKNGEMVTDYYTDNPEYNVVQEDKNAEIVFEKEYEYYSHWFKLYNAYGCVTELFADKANIKVRYIKFKDRYYLIGQYKLSGVCVKDSFFDETDIDHGYRQCSVWGNPVLLTKFRRVNYWVDEENKMRRVDFPSSYFKEDEIETYCWVTIDASLSKDLFLEEDFDELRDDFVASLMADIPGEAG